MAKTQTKSKTQQKDILSQMRELSSEALHRLTEVPGGSRLMEMANDTKARLDDMQKRLLGLEDLERRVAKLEQQLSAQNATKATTARKSASSRKSTSGTAASRKASTPPKSA